MDIYMSSIFGLLGVALGAFLAIFKDVLFKRSERKRNANYLAIRVVSLLDEFINGCVAVIFDDGTYHGQRDEDGYRRAQVSTPEIAPLNLDVDWKSIQPILMYEILSLPNLKSEADIQISGSSEYSASPPDFEEFFEERQSQYSELGLKAIKLATKLRKQHSIPENTYKNFSPAEEMIKCKSEVLHIRSQRAEYQAKMFKGLKDAV